MIKKFIYIGSLALVLSLTISFNRAAADYYPEVGSVYHGFWNYQSDDERSRALDSLKSAGGTWLRIDIGWASVEESKDVYSPWSLNRYDSVINDAHDKGFKILLVVKDTPDWAHDTSDTRVPPDDSNELGEFMKDLSIRYSGKVQAMEIWNEPNNPEFFKAKQAGNEAEEFFDMATTAYEWVKNLGDNSMTVFPGGSSYVDDEWWQQLYELGIKDFSDIIALNPYMGRSDESPLEPDQGNKWRLQHLPTLINLMNTYGDEDKPIWFTEIGWSVHEDYSEENWLQPVTEENQALYLRQALDLVKDSYPQVSNVFWYNLRSRANDQVHANNFGLLNYDLSERLAMTTMRSMLTANAQPPVDPDQGNGDNGNSSDTAVNIVDNGASDTSDNQMESQGRLADTGSSAYQLSFLGLTVSLLGAAMVYNRQR